MTNKKNFRILTAAVPFFMVLLAETVTGNLKYMTLAGFLLNLAVYYLLYMGIPAFFGTTRYGWPVLCLLLYVLAAGEYFVISFRQRPAMIWDVLALRTAMTVSANYKYTITPRLVLTFLGTAACGLASWKWPLEVGRKRGFSARKYAAAAWTGICVSFGIFLFGVLVPALDLGVHMWDPIISFEKEGFMLSTVLSFQTLLPPKPDGYSAELARDTEASVEAEYESRKAAGAKMPEGASAKGAEEEMPEAALAEGAEAEVPEAALAEETVIPENIICIMNESFADLRIYNGLNGDRSFETDGEYLAFFDGLTENTQKGNLYVPVFGAMTANSEYEFLTGNSCAFMPQGSIPYQFYTSPGDSSLASILGGQGYRTVAMHPYPGYNWNRTKAYENLGFDEFLDLEYYDGLEQKIALTRPRGYMSDASDYDGILQLLKEKKPGEKLFIFNVTMQNHGGYEVDGLEASVHVVKMNGRECKGEYPKADQYLTLMKMSDEALRYLLEALKGIDAPTMVVLFGDHQPSVETGFFEELYGMRWSEVPDEWKLNSFVTPYLIWTNYDRKTESSGNMSAFMLGNEVLKAAGVPLSGHRAAAGILQKDYPAVHSMGVLDSSGHFTDILEAGSLDTFPEIRNYHILQYRETFGKR